MIRPIWYTSAMEAFKKAADGGNCIAMMEIGDLYSKGNGVPADKALAQSGRRRPNHAGRQCGNTATANFPVSGQGCRIAPNRAIPCSPRFPISRNPRLPVARNGQRSGVSWNSDFLGSLVAAVVIATAISALIPDSPNAGNPSVQPPTIDYAGRTLYFNRAALTTPLPVLPMAAIDQTGDAKPEQAGAEQAGVRIQAHSTN